MFTRQATMLYFTSLIISALLILVNAQDCSQGPPRIHPSECCPNSDPNKFDRSEAEQCGLSMPDGAGGGGPGGPGGPGGQGPPSCEVLQCVLRKNNLLTADNKFDKAAWKTMAEQKLSSDWTSAIATAIATCDADTTSDDCEARKYSSCLRDKLFLNCPASVFVQSTDCSAMKVFMEKCPMSGPPRQ